jgi:hypothetical protein
MLFAWTSDLAVAQMPAAGQGRIISITGNLSVRRVSVASRALAVNETVGIGFTNTAFNRRHGIQHGDGCTNEMTRADVTALLPVGTRISAAAENFRARQGPPGRRG